MSASRSTPRTCLGVVVAAGLVAAGPAARAACTVSQSNPADNAVIIQSPTFAWVASGCSQYRVYFSPSGDFGADKTVTSWQTAKNYKMSEASWDSHQATDWATRVSWKVEGQAADLSTVQTGSRTVVMDPNLDDDSASVAQGDCNDDDPLVYPGAAETCDGIDEDCDGVADDGLTFEPWYVDLDLDGYGDPGVTVSTCDGPPAGYVVSGTDCADADPAVHPGAAETCNGIDDDCDGLADQLYVYPDVDLDGYGDDTAPANACGGPLPGYIAQAGDCDDGDASVNPDAAEVCDDGIDQDCDGGGGECGLYGDVDAGTTADISIPGYKYYEIGNYPWDTGDLNGDGFADAFVTTTKRPYPRNQGAVYGFFGPLDASARIGNADFRIQGDTNNRYLGVYAAVGGDFNGDGATDLLVSAQESSGSGTVFLFNGPITPGTHTLAEADAEFRGYASYDQSIVASSVGDLDKDGRDELAIGSYGGDIVNESGWVDVYYGPVGGVYETGWGDLAYYGDDNSQVGWSIRTGDVDGDGETDLVFSAPYDTYTMGANTYTSSGTVHVCYGPNTWGGYLDDECPDMVRGAESSDYLGGAKVQSMALADMDGDGADDLLLGAYDGGGAQRGAAFICHGPVTGVTFADECGVVIQATAVSEDYSFGTQVRAGDLDGNGALDLVVSDPSATNGCNGINPGAVHVYYGPFAPGGEDLDTSDSDVRLSDASLCLSQYFGSSLAVADFDGDGIDDIMAGAPYRAAAGINSGLVRVWFGGGM